MHPMRAFALFIASLFTQLMIVKLADHTVRIFNNGFCFSLFLDMLFYAAKHAIKLSIFNKEIYSIDPCF